MVTSFLYSTKYRWKQWLFIFIFLHILKWQHIRTLFCVSHWYPLSSSWFTSPFICICRTSSKYMSASSGRISASKICPTAQNPPLTLNQIPCAEHWLYFCCHTVPSPSCTVFIGSVPVRPVAYFSPVTDTSFLRENMGEPHYGFPLVCFLFSVRPVILMQSGNLIGTLHKQLTPV